MSAQRRRSMAISTSVSAVSAGSATGLLTTASRKFRLYWIQSQTTRSRPRSAGEAQTAAMIGPSAGPGRRRTPAASSTGRQVNRPWRSRPGPPGAVRGFRGWPARSRPPARAPRPRPGSRSLLDDLGRRAAAPSAATWSAGHPAQPAVHVVGHVHPGHLAPHVLERARDLTGPTPARIEHRSCRPRSRTCAIQRANAGDVEDELGLHELRAGGDLLAEPLGPELGRRRERVLDRADEAVAAAGPASGRTAAAPGPAWCRRVQISWTLSRSKTGLASGWSPNRGGRRSAAARWGCRGAGAPSRSDCSAMRLRSRQGICMTGSSPRLQRGQAARPAGQPHVGALVVGDVDRVDPVPQQRGRGGDRLRCWPRAAGRSPPSPRSCPPSGGRAGS